MFKTFTLISVAVVGLFASAMGSAAVRSASEPSLKVQIVVLDDRTLDPAKTVKIGQVLDIGVDESGDPSQVYEFGKSGQVCISGSSDTCRSVSGIETYEGSGRVDWWKVHVQSAMVVNKQFTVRVTFKNETLSQRSFAVVSAALSGPLKVEWTDVGTTGEVEITFPNVFKETPPFAATLRVENSWSDNKEPITGTKSAPKFAHKITRSHVFGFKPAKSFSTPQYKGLISFGLDFDPVATLDVRLQNPFRGSGKSAVRTGTLKFAVIYRGSKVGTQAYFYKVTQTTGHLAKQGSDEFFNYCLKDHPETIFSSGGVLMCQVPGGTEMYVMFLSHLRK